MESSPSNAWKYAFAWGVAAAELNVTLVRVLVCTSFCSALFNSNVLADGTEVGATENGFAWSPETALSSQNCLLLSLSLGSLP